MNKTIQLKDVAILNRETYRKNDLPDNLKYLDTGNLTRNKIEELQHISIKEDKVPSRAQRKVQLDTILYSTVRPNQEHFGIVENLVENLIVSTGFTTIDVSSEEVFPKYLYFLLTQKNLTEYLHSIAQNSVSAYPSLSPNDLGNLKFKIPELPIQKQIAKVLSDLDAKIEVNNQINQQLEAMAKTLYDYWFVQFDFPCPEALEGPEDFAQGRPSNVSSSAACLPAKAGRERLTSTKTTSSPLERTEERLGYKSSGGKMVYNEELKREIPDGWEVKKLGDVCRIVRGASPRPIKDYIRDKGLPWIKISDATKSDCRFILETKQFIKKEGESKTRVLEPGSLILSNSASPAIPRIVQLRSGIHDGWLLIEDFKHNLTKEFLYQYFVTERARILNFGTGSIFKNLKTDYIKDLNIVIPKPEVLKASLKTVTDINSKLLNSYRENQKLTELRDWLLPMLMNGQVTVTSKIKSKSNATSSESREVDRDVDNSNFNDAGDVDGGLGRVAESGSKYGKEQTLEDIFDSINYDNEVGAVIFLTRKTLGRNYGKKYIHKMFSNIQFLSELPVFEDLVFEENGWGMHCSILEKTIENKKFFKMEGIDLDRNVLSFDYSQTKEIARWMDKDDESRQFVANVENMLAIYQQPLIDKSMDRIELFNTVLECMIVLKTDDYNKIRAKMKTWKMFETDNKSKAEKFKPEETRAMIGFVKTLSVDNS